MKQLRPGDTLVLATHNAGKLAELRELLADTGIRVLGAAELNLPEPEETGTTFAENAALKAEAAAQASGFPALADDSGFQVAALNGDPGVYSSRWAKAAQGSDGEAGGMPPEGSPTQNYPAVFARIESLLTGNPDRTAWFSCVIAQAWPPQTETDAETTLFEGRSEGTLTFPARGPGGFGYDPLFIPIGETRTYGEMTRTEKHATSHRARALALWRTATVAHEGG